MEWTLPIILYTTLGVIVGYLLGSCNFAIIITKLFANDDIRNHGSGNAGLTNVLRTLGKGPAALTLVGDFSKGILSVVFIRVLLHFVAGVDNFYAADYLVAYGALIGHVFPLYYGFKGGKGILVSFGAIMILSPIAGLICFSGFLVIVATTKYVSLGSIIAGIMFPLVTGCITYFKNASISWGEVLMALPIAISILYMHRKNIVRLVKKEESKISFKKKLIQ